MKKNNCINAESEKTCVDIIQNVYGNRGNLTEIDKENYFKILNNFNNNHPVDTYHTVYLHPKAEYLNTVEHNKTANKEDRLSFSHQVIAIGLHFDIDIDKIDKNPDGKINLTLYINRLTQVLLQTRQLVKRLSKDYKIPNEYIYIFFSGSKGFHVNVPDINIQEIENNAHEAVRNVCLKIAEGITTLDTSVYDRARLWRMANTINSKSIDGKRYKIPLTVDELFKLNVNQILEMAKERR